MPSAAPSYFPESQFSLSKVILDLGKARSHRAPNLGSRGAESPGWFDVSPKNCMRCDVWAGALLWWSCQSPVAHSCGLLNHLNSFHEGMFKLNAKFDEDSLFYLLSHFECGGHTVHMLSQWHLLPHWLVQWSCHCSRMWIPVHSPWLPGYINIVQTILIILTMVGCFPDRPPGFFLIILVKNVNVKRNFNDHLHYPSLYFWPVFSYHIDSLISQ